MKNLDFNIPLPFFIYEEGEIASHRFLAKAFKFYLLRIYLLVIWYEDIC
jgi:hypothetical protein